MHPGLTCTRLPQITFTNHAPIRTPTHRGIVRCSGNLLQVAAAPGHGCHLPFVPAQCVGLAALPALHLQAATGSRAHTSAYHSCASPLALQLEAGVCFARLPCGSRVWTGA